MTCKDDDCRKCDHCGLTRNVRSMSVKRGRWICFTCHEAGRRGAGIPIVALVACLVLLAPDPPKKANVPVGLQVRWANERAALCRLIEPEARPVTCELFLSAAGISNE